MTGKEYEQLIADIGEGHRENGYEYDVRPKNKKRVRGQGIKSSTLISMALGTGVGSGSKMRFTGPGW
jgi:hypothetical protein